MKQAASEDKPAPPPVQVDQSYLPLSVRARRGTTCHSLAPALSHMCSDRERRALASQEAIKAQTLLQTPKERVPWRFFNKHTR